MPQKTSKQRLAYLKAYREQHRERLAELRHKKYYANQKEILRKKREKYKHNPEPFKLSVLKCDQKNRLKRLSYQTQYRSQNHAMLIKKRRLKYYEQYGEFKSCIKLVQKIQALLVNRYPNKYERLKATGYYERT